MTETILEFFTTLISAYVPNYMQIPCQTPPEMPDFQVENCIFTNTIWHTICSNIRRNQLKHILYYGIHSHH